MNRIEELSDAVRAVVSYTVFFCRFGRRIMHIFGLFFSRPPMLFSRFKRREMPGLSALLCKFRPNFCIKREYIGRFDKWCYTKWVFCIILPFLPVFCPFTPALQPVRRARFRCCRACLYVPSGECERPYTSMLRKSNAPPSCTHARLLAAFSRVSAAF